MRALSICLPPINARIYRRILHVSVAFAWSQTRREAYSYLSSSNDNRM